MSAPLAPGPSTPKEHVTALLAGLTLEPRSSLPPRVARALALARHLQTRGVGLQTPGERRQQAELERMVQNPSDKATLIELTDQAFRSSTPSRAAEQLTHILDVQGVPRFFSVFERAMLKGFQSFGSYLPGVSMPMVKERMRAETANVILPAEPELLAIHLAERRDSGLRMNVNFLGEAMLGERDAHARLQSYLAALQRPEIEVISVKVSTIYSQISPIGRKHSAKILTDRLELLYRAAAKARFVRHDGSSVPKFVYLDMEEFRDLGITVEVFVKALSRPGLEHVGAGLALQAYMPDSFEVLCSLQSWARERVQRGGAPITVRLVKGANMEAERVEASIHGWEQAPFRIKQDTDANYKRMLDVGLTPENARAVRLGVASHNLFDVAYALVLAHDNGVLEHVQFEMLEGMANHQRRALSELASNVLLYSPATKKEEFLNAIGYLVRRLDENTGPENFLRHAFKLDVDSDIWKGLEQAFLRSFERIATLETASRRTQDRTRPLANSAPCLEETSAFDNDAHTDFSLAHNLRWAEGILTKWSAIHGPHAIEIPLVIAGEEVFDDRDLLECKDPSRPGVVVGRYRQAKGADIERALDVARRDPSGWRTLGETERSRLLLRAAHELSEARADLLGAALADGGKLLSESDPELSEAIDFVRYYAATARDFRALDSVEASPKGVVVVVPPWNFPIAIPCGGIAAALAAGNTVILKPASHTVLVAYELCKCFWRAGVSKDALQFLPCSGRVGGEKLVCASEVDVVILTGGTATALRMLDQRPELQLLAETGGKNATIVTAMSDRDLAIKHIVQSAFGHSGQKCSATSLLILEGEVYDDPGFKRTLCDAVESMTVGSAWEFETRMGPVISPPSGELERGLKELEDGESWALMSENQDDNPCLYGPAVKWGVRPGSYTHLTEFFGPVLAVMRADNLEHAISLVNQTGYGLTSGLESLDEREQAIWREGIAAGNLYINRGTTGAIVLRQPFGGVGKSAFGPGIKAGGPNYVAQLMSFRDRDNATPSRAARALAEPMADPDLEGLRLALIVRRESAIHDLSLSLAELDRVLAALVSYADSHAREFGVEHDHFKLVGQDNIRRYRPVRTMRVRVHAEDSAFEVFARVLAGKTIGCRVIVSSPPKLDHPAVRLLDALTESWGASVDFLEETDSQLAAVIAKSETHRVRYASPARVPTEVLRAVGDTGVYVARSPVLAEGRIELLWYLTEQSVSHDYHRYGNLGRRAAEPRREVR
ncbi:MAG: aldehyde dehydrogenase family protein [Myxococcales bacterium]|nr:aldehyde dehydrogenase family protein [Myxococcales bacterium]